MNITTDTSDIRSQLNIVMKKFVKCFIFALDGIYNAIKSEQNFRIHLILMLLAIACGIYLGLSILEWSLIIFAIGFVLAAELFNTSVERLSDKVSGGEISPLVKNSKDLAAGGVLIAAITALVIGILILLIPFIQKVVDL